MVIAALDGLKIEGEMEREELKATFDRQASGYETPAQFFQAGLIHAWFSRRAPHSAA